MATISRHEDLEIWQLARDQARKIYKLTSELQFAADPGLVRQVRDAAGSVMDNIAEGFDRGGNREFIHFLTISRASNAEVRLQLVRAFDFELITAQQFGPLTDKSEQLGTKINNFIEYLKTSDYRGQKFR